MLASNTYHIKANVVMSKIELIGPKNSMKRPMSAGCQRCGCLSISSSTLSNGMAICEMS